jgi:hypothetical protein
MQNHEKQRKRLINCRAEQFNATDRLLKIFENARCVYIDYVKIARVALKGDRTALQKLELTGLRKKEFSLWLSEAKAFYNGALETPEIQTKLNRFGLTRKVLKEGLNLVKEAENQREIRNRLKADAIDATRKRNAALKKAESWRSDLVTVARVAIKGSAAQRLEVLDLTITGEYSERTQAQADAEMLVEIPGEPEPQEPEEVIKE